MSEQRVNGLQVGEEAMNDQLPILGGDQHRVKRVVTIIRSEHGDMQTEQIERTDISSDGNVISTATVSTSQELDGEIIRDTTSEIIGKCQHPGCGQFLTERTRRDCANQECNMILCHHHARFHRKENEFFCHECYKSVRMRWFFLTLFSAFGVQLSKRGGHD